MKTVCMYLIRQSVLSKSVKIASNSGAAALLSIDGVFGALPPGLLNCGLSLPLDGPSCNPFLLNSLCVVGGIPSSSFGLRVSFSFGELGLYCP